jgi:hypothetical protein
MAGLPTVAPKRAVTTTAPMRTNSAANAKQAAPTTPFTRASLPKSMFAFSVTQQLQTVSYPLVQQPIPAAGYFRWLELQIVGVTAGNSATTAFNADGPWNVIQQISLVNNAGDTLISPLTGYQLFVCNKYFALSEDPPNNDPRRDNQYSTTTGAGATGGSFSCSLRLPAEVDGRDAFCAIPNGASNKQYIVNLTLAPSSTVYTTAPTTAPLVTVSAVSYFWTAPNATSSTGNPQATAPIGNGSVSMLRVNPVPVTPGDKYFPISTGNVIRNVAFVLRTAAGVRTVADWPLITSIVFNNDVLFYKPQGQWLNDMASNFGLNTAAVEQAGGLDNGVYILTELNNQRGKILADSPRDNWLPTLDTSSFQIHGTSFGANASTLEVITNEIKPVSSDALYSFNVS